MKDSFSNRVAWIDAVRIFAMLTVVFGHSIGASHLPNQTMFVWWVVAWNMPLFIVLSGFTSCKSLEKITTWKQYYQYLLKLGKRMLVPAAVIGLSMNTIGCVQKAQFVKLAIIMSIIAALLLLYGLYRKRPDERYLNLMALISISIELTTSHFWFLSMLFCTLMVFALCHLLTCRLNRHRLCRDLLFASIVVIWGGYFEKFEMGDMAIYLLIGVFFYKEGTSKSYNLMETNWPLWVMPVVGGVLSFSLGEKVYFYDYSEMILLHDRMFHFYLLRLLCGTCWSIWFLCLFSRCVKKYNTFCYWGTLTIGIYMVHGYFLRYVSAFYKHIDYEAFPTAVQFLIGVLPAFILTGISLAAVYLFKKHHITRELFLGEFKNENPN